MQFGPILKAMTTRFIPQRYNTHTIEIQYYLNLDKTNISIKDSFESWGHLENTDIKKMSISIKFEDGRFRKPRTHFSSYFCVLVPV